MRTATFFCALFVLALLAPHVEGWLVVVWFVVFVAALYGLLKQGITREEDSHRRS